jgi:hypothetical protein
VSAEDQAVNGGQGPVYRVSAEKSPVQVGDHNVQNNYFAQGAQAGLPGSSPGQLTYRECRVAFAELVRSMPDVPLRVAIAPRAVEVRVRRSDEPGRLSFPAAELAYGENDCWLTGGPGSGKSRQLREWSLRLCEDPAPSPATPVPLLVRAADVLAYARSPSKQLNPLPRILADAVNAALKGAHREPMPGLEKLLRDRSDTAPPWLLLVDGLDEIPDAASRRQVLRTLQASASTGWRCRTVVASRPTHDFMKEARHGPEGGDDGGEEEEPSWPPERYELLALDEEQRDELLLSWFADLGEKAPGQSLRMFADEIRLKGLGDLLQQPLMLVILAQLFVAERAGSLPASRAAAYEEIVHQVFGAYRERIAAAAIGNIPHSLLEQLADPGGLVSQLALARYKGEVGNAAEWLTAQTDGLRKYAGITPPRWELIVREVLPQVPLLVARGDDYDFVHTTLYEYLAARALADDYRASVNWRGWRLNVSAGTPRWDLSALSSYLQRPGYSAADPFADWLYAFWVDWPLFQEQLLQMLQQDPLGTCAFIASLAWRHVPVAPRVEDAVRRELLQEMEMEPRRDRILRKRVRSTATRPAGHVLTAATCLAMLGDHKGRHALAGAAKDPADAELRVTAALILRALGDSRGDDLFAEAVKAAVEAPMPSPVEQDWSGGSGERYRRCHLARDLVRAGHPAAAQVMRVIVTDGKYDSAIRGYAYEMLSGPAARGDRHCADMCAALLCAPLPGAASEEVQGRDRAFEHLLAMTDPGSADRLAAIAGAGTAAGEHRLAAACKLAETGDPRAADVLAGLLAGSPDPGDRWRIAWVLAGTGDLRAVPVLAAAADPRARHGGWDWWREAMSVARSGSSAATGVLVELASVLPTLYRARVLLAICDNCRDGQALDLAAEIGADGSAEPVDLYTLADALARHGDPRFDRVLRAWISSDDTEYSWADPSWIIAGDHASANSRADGARRDEAAKKEWAAAVLANPALVLGVGLYVAAVTSRTPSLPVLPLSVRWAALQSLQLAGHPRTAELMAGMLPELMDESEDNCAASEREEILVYLAARNRREAVPYLEVEARSPGQDYRSSRYGFSGRAVEALTAMDGQEAADALVALAPSLPGESRRPVAERLAGLGHEKTTEIVYGWVEKERTGPRKAPFWMIQLLVQLRAPCAVDLIDEDVIAQISDGKPLFDSGWMISGAIETLAGFGQDGADKLARWVLDNRFHLKDKIDALIALHRLGDERATMLRDELAEDRTLSRVARMRVREALPGPAR